MGKARRKTHRARKGPISRPKPKAPPKSTRVLRSASKPDPRSRSRPSPKDTQLDTCYLIKRIPVELQDMILVEFFKDVQIRREKKYKSAGRGRESGSENTSIVRTCRYMGLQATKIMYNNLTMTSGSLAWLARPLSVVPAKMISQLRYIEYDTGGLVTNPGYLLQRGLKLKRLTINNLNDDLQFHVSYPQVSLQWAAMKDWKELEIICSAKRMSRRPCSFARVQPRHDWANNRNTYPDCWNRFLDFPCSLTMLYEDESSHAKADDPLIKVTHDGKPGGPFKTETGESIWPNWSGMGVVHIIVKRHGD
ncbi:hypothetical protein GLAREA_02785 [Glarea lozoyensis ATCC 20868]|uniref:Uncharacterized protein n=1 Tax=Glarea lozoyensis (strain ATCC 20868 / MF5171) TaxID=1116229 RepID=S3D486_GLAL2|nr:uncharacterized protein GLAREA_02785 [Glarea lozoyensis ATCC 20868]EPE26871.1 hypothetical protein GLAREA_02785 [Glarea lozoyensis ATCC 20868]